MTPYRELAVQVLQDLDEDHRRELAEDPAGTVERAGVAVCPFPTVPPESDECSCDGVYYHTPKLVIGYVPTPHSRRQSFTILHEYGHHLIRHHDDVLSELADIDDDGGKAAEERVCDALASLILIPENTAAEILNGSRPLAHHLHQLYQHSHASMEACAVRLAEHLPGLGYVVIADPTTHSIRFASPSPSTPYRWARGTTLPDTHRLWRAAGNGTYRGQAPIIWATRNRTEAWLDAVAHGDEIHAVFSQQRHWDEQTASVLEGGLRPARGIAYRGACRHCGHTKWGYSLHEPCGETRCRKCGRCGCGAAQPREPERRTCPSCGLSKRNSLFQEGTERCRDCET